MDISNLTGIVGAIIYAAQAGVALWGAYCCVIIWQRVGQKRFKNEQLQEQFLESLNEPLARGDFDALTAMVEEDARAIPQLAALAVLNRSLGFVKVRQLVEDRFQRDVLADLEHRLTWVNTVIKSAPMLGLFGTVVGMMGAFGKLHLAENVQADVLAGDIMLALITTAIGLAIAIPLIIAVAAINIRIRKMEELTVAGLNHYLEALQAALARAPKRS
jgi:biopolymer transport protein ExbB/TolQ